MIRGRSTCTPPAALLALLCMLISTPTAADDSKHARLNFIQHCSGCHLADGSGAPARGIPSMRNTLGQFLKVPGGREFIVQVPGVMNSSLNDRDIAVLMNWLLPEMASNTLPAETPPYTAAELARLRKTRPADVLATRRQLMGDLRRAGIAIDGDAAP